MTLKEIAEKIKSGELSGVMMIDNDYVAFIATDEDWLRERYNVHPEELMEQALDLLGIPHERV